MRKKDTTCNNFSNLDNFLSDAKIKRRGYDFIEFEKNEINVIIQINKIHKNAFIKIDTSWYGRKRVPSIDESDTFISLLKICKKRKEIIEHNNKINEKVEFLFDVLIQELTYQYKEYNCTIKEACSNCASLKDIERHEVSINTIYSESVRNWICDRSQ
jgi:hypothetical protein